MWYLFGGHGWIGRQFLAYLAKEHSNISVAVPTIRLDDTAGLTVFLHGLDPLNDRVISFIGRTHGGSFTTIDYLEQGRPQLIENVRDNFFGPAQAMMLCQSLGIHFTYLGTGCIFSYDETEHPFGNVRKGFTEESLPNFFGSSYSIVKGFTDRFAHLFNDSCLNLRIRMPINADLSATRNFITKILTYSKVCSIPNSMTVLPDMFPIMYQMIQARETGTWNMTNPGKIEHNQILELYKKYIDPDFQYTNFSLEEQSKILLSERSNNILCTQKLESKYFILPIYQSMCRLMRKIAIDRIQRENHHVLSAEDGTSNILVTGGYGFVGSNFLHHLVRCKINGVYSIGEIVNVDKNSYCSVPELLDDISTYVTSYDIDINETDGILNILRRHSINVVVHFAAQSHVDNSFGNSIEFTMDNIRGTHSLLEASRQYGHILRFLHMSTDEVYGENLTTTPFTETVLPNPTNPYAATKISAEFLVQSYFHCFQLPILIVRGNNIYGPRQFPEKLIPKNIYRILNKQKVLVQGDGQTRRNYMYVDDICEGILRVLDQGVINEIYNIGDPKDEQTVMSVLETLLRELLPESRKDLAENMEAFVEYTADRYFNDFSYSIDCSKIQSLGWKPKMSFAEGIRKTIDYYRRMERRYQ